MQGAHVVVNEAARVRSYGSSMGLPSRLYATLATGISARRSRSFILTVLGGQLDGSRNRTGGFCSSFPAVSFTGSLCLRSQSKRSHPRKPLPFSCPSGRCERGGWWPTVGFALFLGGFRCEDPVVMRRGSWSDLPVPGQRMQAVQHLGRQG